MAQRRGVRGQMKKTTLHRFRCLSTCCGLTSSLPRKANLAKRLATLEGTSSLTSSEARPQQGRGTTNTKASAAVPAYRKAGRYLVDRKTRPTDRQTDRQTDIQTDRQTDRHDRR